MNMKTFLHKYQDILQVGFTLVLSAIVVIPQIIQQLLYDLLPATGDLVHRRAVYILTNFPNFDAPILVWSHSPFHNILISYFNILIGLTDNLAFYGMTIVNLLMLPLASLTILIIARRVNARWAFLAPLLFLNNTNLVLPFTGHANQHLIFLFFGLSLFILLNLRATVGTRIIATLFLGATFNSSIAIWLPLVLILLFLDIHRPAYRPLFIGIVALILYLPFLTPAVSYLAFSDYSGTLQSFPKLLLILTTVLLTLKVVDTLLRHHSYIRKWLIIGGGTIGPLLFFLIPRSEGAFSGNISPELIETSKRGLRSSFNVINQIFVVNQNDHAAGFDVYIPMVFLILILGSLVLYYSDRKRISPTTKLLLWITLIPAIITILRITLFLISYEYVARTALFQLHSGRLMSMSLFLLPIILIYFISHLHQHLGYGWIRILAVILVINMTFISAYAAQRMVPNWTQQAYQHLIQQSLELGVPENLSPLEGHYACQFYNHCSTRFIGGRF
jgi:hypothetical protein